MRSSRLFIPTDAKRVTGRKETSITTVEETVSDTMTVITEAAATITTMMTAVEVMATDSEETTVTGIATTTIAATVAMTDGTAEEAPLTDIHRISTARVVTLKTASMAGTRLNAIANVHGAETDSTPEKIEGENGHAVTISVMTDTNRNAISTAERAMTTKETITTINNFFDIN
jgi:hypothetical protein